MRMRFPVEELRVPLGRHIYRGHGAAEFWGRAAWDAVGAQRPTTAGKFREGSPRRWEYSPLAAPCPVLGPGWTLPTQRVFTA